MIQEVGQCFSETRVCLRLELRRSRVGAWELELSEIDGRRISHRYDDEATARTAAETAYTYGRQFGRWRIQRAAGYKPVGIASAEGWDPAPAQRAEVS